MQVEYVFVDEIRLDSASQSGIVHTTVFEFGDRHWVSLHPERGGHPVGPLTILEKEKPPKLRALSFPERMLHTNSTQPWTFSFKDTSTMRPWTVYTLVLPAGFIADPLRLTRSDHHPGATEHKLGITEEGKLFYFAIFIGEAVLDIEAVICKDHKRYEEQRHSTEVVAGAKEYGELRKAIGRTAASPDFWFKLLDFGSKLFRN